MRFNFTYSKHAIMQSVRKDYLLVLSATALACILSLILLNANTILNNGLIWQASLFAAGTFVLFSIVKLYQLSQKVSDQLKLKKASNN